MYSTYFYSFSFDVYIYTVFKCVGIPEKIPLLTFGDSFVFRFVIFVTVTGHPNMRSFSKLGR